ncbi:MAG: helix-turn-helix domain-containing protein [Eubacteriales bacterium]|nr:helix-turn-helix domain-containing protein [Eubacteriales bacterium]
MQLELGPKIRQLRLQRGMTQEQLGAALGLSAQAVSKWENQTTMPDIQLLPELSVLLGVTIDALFSMTDESRMARIENRLEDVRFLPQQEFEAAEQYLREQREEPQHKARAALLLARLYNKRAQEYHDLAKPLAREALLLNPENKGAHNAVFDAENCVYPDWNAANRWQTIEFYQDFVARHPENRVNYLWLMDLLIADGRTEEARTALRQMERVEYTYHVPLYEGLIAKAEGDHPRAMACWDRMMGEYTVLWTAWFCRGDCMARLCRYDEAVDCYRRAMELQPEPKYVDAPEAIAQIAEIRGDYDLAIGMRETCMEILRRDCQITEGELLEVHRREITRLREKQRTAT